MENHGAPRVVLVDVVIALPQPPLRVGDARGVLPPLALDETRPPHPRSVRLELIHPRVGLGCVSRANQQAPSDLVLPFSRRRTSARAGSVPSPSGAGPPPAPGAVVMRPTVPCPVRQLLRSRVERARVRFRASDSRFELEVPQPVAVAPCQLRREGRGGRARPTAWEFGWMPGFGRGGAPLPRAAVAVAVAVPPLSDATGEQNSRPPLRTSRRRLSLGGLPTSQSQSPPPSSSSS